GRRRLRAPARDRAGIPRAARARARARTSGGRRRRGDGIVCFRDAWSPPSLFVTLSEVGDLLLDLVEGLDPLGEHATPRRRDHVDPLRGPRSLVVPCGVDEALALEGSEDSVEV